MELGTFLVVVLTFVSWGVGSFIAKLATNRIGAQGIFWDVIGYTPAVIIYSLLVYKFQNLIQADKFGIGLALLSGAIGSLGAVGFYILLSKAEVSTMAPLAALYPALTAILAFVFLRESVTSTKLLGILFSLIAIYLLSK